MIFMRNKIVKWVVILISAMFFLVLLCGAATSNKDYENYEKNYVRYTSGPPSNPLDYREFIRQSGIKLKFSGKINLLIF